MKKKKKKTRSRGEAAASCYRYRLNGNLYLTSIEGPVGMTYAIILFPPGARKQYFLLIDLKKKALKMIFFFSLHCSGCFSACRGAHFPVCEEDHGTGLALRLALLGCQGSCDIVTNGPTSSFSGSSVDVRARNVSM